MENTLQTTLEKSISAYEELLNLSNQAMELVTANRSPVGDIIERLQQQFTVVTEIDRMLPQDLEIKENALRLQPLLHKRADLIAQVLMISRNHTNSLQARKAIITDELGKIRKGRGSLPAYKEQSSQSGKIFQSRF